MVGYFPTILITLRMRIPKILLPIFLIFFFFESKCQEISGCAYYSVLVSTDSSNNTPEELWMLSAYPFVPKVASMMTFKLEFTTTKSLFTLEKSKELDKLAKGDVKTTETLVGYKDSTWQDNEYCYLFDRDMKNPLDKKGLMLKTNNNFDWKISTETKQIGEFTCHKATGNIETSYREEGIVKVKKTPVIAWFCPDIPVPFGPIYSRNLPGLVFEFQEGGTLYGLKALNLSSRPEIKPLPNKEIITKEEWRTRLYEKAKDLNIPY